MLNTYFPDVLKLHPFKSIPKRFQEPQKQNGPMGAPVSGDETRPAESNNFEGGLSRVDSIILFFSIINIYYATKSTK